MAPAAVSIVTSPVPVAPAGAVALETTVPGPPLALLGTGSSLSGEERDPKLLEKRASQRPEWEMDVDDDNRRGLSVGAPSIAPLSEELPLAGSSPSTLGGDSDTEAETTRGERSPGKKRVRTGTDSSEEGRSGIRGGRPPGGLGSRRGQGRSRGR